MRTIEEKKDTELFSSCLVFQVHFAFQTNTECFWSHRSRKEGLDNAGWSGRSYIVLLVVLVLRRRRRSVGRTFDASHDVFKTGRPNCDLVFMRLSSSLRQDDTEDIFLSLFTY